MCQQGALRFNIPLKERFSISVSVRVMKKYDKSAAMQISEVFGAV